MFWSFFGVRKGRDMLQERPSIKPVHVVIVGLVAGWCSCWCWSAIVTFITRNAG